MADSTSCRRQFETCVEFTVAMFVAFNSILVFPSVALPAGPAVPEGWVFRLPAGDAAAGEKAFAKMQCYSCHAVAGKDFQDPLVESGNIGPTFTADYAKLPASYLAESIINPDRFLPHGPFKLSYLDQGAFQPAGREDYEVHSRMARYLDIITARELIDIVAFIKSLGPIEQTNP